MYYQSTMNFTYPSRREYDTKQKVNTKNVFDGIAVLGNIQNLPFQDELLQIIEPLTSTEKAKRIIIVDPEQYLLNTAMKAYSKAQLIVIVTKKSALTGSADIPIFAVKSDSIPGLAGFQMIHNVNVVTGKIPVTLLYTFLFDLEKNIVELDRYKLGYHCSIDFSKAFNKPKPSYTTSIPLHELVDKNHDKTIDVSNSTLICACHFTSEQEIGQVVDRCVKLMKAIDHDNIIYVYSLVDEKQDILKQHIESLCMDNTYFIYDTKNNALDAGKYLLGLNSIISIDDVYENDGVITLFNDSVLMSDDLTSFSADYKSSTRKYDIIGCISSNERSWHIQSWFLSFTNNYTINDYKTLLSILSIDNEDIRISIVDQMEIGISAFLSSKYNAGAIYPVHNITETNVMCSYPLHAKYLRPA